MQRSGESCATSTTCLITLTVGFPAHAGDQFRMLDGKQIQARVVGQDITDGPHWSMYVRSDGVLIGEESGSSWTGSWKIRNDKLCFTMPSSPSVECNEVWMSGTHIRVRANKDGGTFEALVMAHGKKR